ncbi:hypothetical protein RHMOL_Rhmol05G0027800 [Rhododendron molle]|uniref:Uncharacterized protein n=1 Tax=Rhododendron molle TaxID=49168 RepID=A0ACC0NKS9_RHOML|nr:hypothetical protein RHMOL_Rhmol05G0027800 [Rhododendron molle]
MKPIVACIFVVYFLMIFASLVRFYVFVMPLGGSKMLAVDVSIGPYQWLGRSPSYHEVLTPVQLLLRLHNHHHHTQAAMTTTPQTSLAMDQELVRSSTQPSASPPLSLSEIPTPKAPEKPQVPIKKIQQAKGKGRVISENLRQYFGQKRKDVAARLRVSVSTFKRMCRQQGIMRWPGMGSSGSVSKPPDQHGERNTSTAWGTPSRNVETGMEVEPVGQPDSFEDLNFWNIEIGSIAEIPSDWDFLALEEETSLVGLVSGSVNLTVAACSDPAPRQHPMLTIPDTMTTTHMMSHLAAKGDVRFVTLKVTYGKKIIKFQFPLMSGIMELKEEVKKRLKLELDSFDVEYKDEDGDCIFLGCDEDLRNHLQHFSNQVIRLLIVDSDANTSNFR